MEHRNNAIMLVDASEPAQLGTIKVCLGLGLGLGLETALHKCVVLWPPD